MTKHYTLIHDPENLRASGPCRYPINPARGLYGNFIFCSARFEVERISGLSTKPSNYGVAKTDEIGSHNLATHGLERDIRNARNMLKAN